MQFLLFSQVILKHFQISLILIRNKDVKNMGKAFHRYLTKLGLTGKNIISEPSEKISYHAVKKHIGTNATLLSRFKAPFFVLYFSE